MNLQNRHERVVVLRTKEKEILAEMLEHLRQIYAHKFYLRLGHTSLFQYLVKELGYSEGSAQRRVQALRLSEKHPTLKSSLDKGQINLSNLCLLGRALEQNKMAPPEQKELIKATGDLSFRELEKKIMQKTGQKKEVKPELRRASPTSYKLTVELSEAGQQKLEKIKGLHSLKNKNLNAIVEEALDLYLKAKSPEFMSAKPRAIKHQSVTKALKSEVWKKARGFCQYPGCHSTHLLEVEHLHPQGKGGDHHRHNLALYCRAHNVYSALRTYGMKGAPSMKDRG